jgi:ArsR family transcriptional regulator
MPAHTDSGHANRTPPSSNRSATPIAAVALRRNVLLPVAVIPAACNYIDVAQLERQASIPLSQVGARQPQLGQLPELLKVLADPTRLRIAGLLAQRELCVCDLEDLLGISQSMTSHHIGVLRRAGLLIQRREDRDARWAYYRLNPEAIEHLRDSFDRLLDLSGFDPTPARCD